MRGLERGRLKMLVLHWVVWRCFCSIKHDIEMVAPIIISCTVMLLCKCVRMGREGCVCVCSVTAMTFSPHCSSAVIPESTDPQQVKDPSNSGNTEALSDKASPQSQQLTGTVAVSVWCMVKQLLRAFPPPPICFFYMCG